MGLFFLRLRVTRLRSVSILPILLVLAASGCAHGPHGSRFLTEETRAAFGTVGVTSGRLAPGAELVVPARGAGEGAAKAAGLTVLYGIGGGAQSGHPIGLAMGAALGVAAAPVGAVVGAARALPVARAEMLEDTVRKGAADGGIQGRFRDRLLETAREETGRPFVPVDGSIAGALAFRGIDTVLEATIVRIDLVGEKWSRDPPVVLSISARVRLARVRDGEVLYERTFAQNGFPEPASEWIARGAPMFEERFEEASRLLALRIVEDLFLLYIAPRRPAKETAS